jgi:hypothetical protein
LGACDKYTVYAGDDADAEALECDATRRVHEEFARRHKEHDCPLNTSEPAKTMEASGICECLKQLYEQGIVVITLLGDGDNSWEGQWKQELIKMGHSDETAAKCIPDTVLCPNHLFKEMPYDAISCALLCTCMFSNVLHAVLYTGCTLYCFVHIGAHKQQSLC